MKTVVISAIVAVLVIVVGVGAFFVGNNHGQQQAQNIRNDFLRARQGGAGAPNGAPGQAGQNGQGGQFGQNGQPAGPVGRPAAFGTVKSVNGNTIVVTQQDGSTVTVTVDSQTAIQKTTNGTISDIQPGERVTVLSDQTGSTVTARSIQLRPTAQQ
jgi:hypothetical protein